MVGWKSLALMALSVAALSWAAPPAQAGRYYGGGYYRPYYGGYYRPYYGGYYAYPSVGVVIAPRPVVIAPAPVVVTPVPVTAASPPYPAPMLLAPVPSTSPPPLADPPAQPVIPQVP